MIQSLKIQKISVLLLLLMFALQTAEAGVSVIQTNGIRFTGVNGIDYIGTNGLRFTGADGFLNTQVNGMRFTGADGTRFTGADGTRFTGADGVTYTGSNGMRFTGADGVRFTGADGVRFTGADGVRFTGADGTTYRADSIVVTKARGVEVVKPVNISFIGVDGVRFTGADGTAVMADGLRFTGADGIRFTGADTIVGFNSNGVVFNLAAPSGFSISGPDGTRFTGADAVFTQVNDLRFTGADGIRFTGADGDFSMVGGGLQTIDPKLALMLNEAADDSTINAVVVFYQYPNAIDLNNLRQIGIIGGTQFKILPMIYIAGTKQQIAAISQLANVRTIYGNRTLTFNSDPYFKTTQMPRVAPDRDLQNRNAGAPVSGKNITVAVLDTGVNGQHGDLAGKVLQNVRLFDTQSAAVGFINPLPVENLPNTDLVNGHGTFVAGIIAGSGAGSSGKYGGVAPGANILGLSAGDLSLISILSGFDYLLEKGGSYNVRVVNCSFSSDSIFDYNDPVNIATRMLTNNNINVVFSAGNSGAGNSSLNPYAAAPWVVSVGATDEKGVLADFSSRGVFGSAQFSPSLVAPGVNIVSLRALGTQTGTLGLAGGDLQRLSPGELPFYTTDSGTSFSAPQVSGAIALMLETNPNLTTAQVKSILQRSATPLPNYYSHEVGAGMLNTYAAVLESAFPARKTGLFRSALSSETVQFVSSVTSNFEGVVGPGGNFSTPISVPANTVQSSIYIAWGGLLNQNDLSLKVYDPSGTLSGSSDYLNIADIAGKNEKITINSPVAGNWQAVVQNTYNIGSSQSFQGLVETTRIQYGQIDDLTGITGYDQAAAMESLRKFLLLPSGTKFLPNAPVSRADLAAALVRSGKVPQFVAASQAFSDVSDLTNRNAAESVQFSPNGKLIYDAGTNGEFRPMQFATRLTAAIAFVKAAQLESLAAGSTLPPDVLDTASIPVLWRGYAAVALQKGWLSLKGNRFNPNASMTRLDLANMLVSK